jgi:hypothetical protein
VDHELTGQGVTGLELDALALVDVVLLQDATVVHRGHSELDPVAGTPGREDHDAGPNLVHHDADPPGAEVVIARRICLDSHLLAHENLQ